MVPSCLHALRIALISACAVMSLSCQTVLWLMLMIFPSLTILAPKGACPFVIPSCAFLTVFFMKSMVKAHTATFIKIAFFKSNMRIVNRVVAKDGTQKFLVRLADTRCVECVLIFHKTTVCACISSQVGCAMKCTFCATGKMGFTRNLSSEEIVGQLDLMQDSVGQQITNVVFMGMGEPLMNYDSVVAAVNEFRRRGISWRKITVSTVGLPDKIRRLSTDTQCLLALSLHAPTDGLRSSLVPVNARYPIRGLIDACVKHPAKHNLPVMIEYVMLKDVNDKIVHARQLAEVLRPLAHVMINLIPYNDTGAYECSDESTMREFKKCLIGQGYKTIIRTTKGQDSSAACGMLAVKVI